MHLKESFLYWFKQQKIGKKIFYTFLPVVIIPLLVTQILMLSVISNSIKKEVHQMMKNQLVQIAERTNLTLETYTTLVYQIYADNQIVEAVKNYSSKNGILKEAMERELYDRIQQYGSSVAGIECISIILPNGNDITYDFRMASVVDTLWSDKEDVRELTPYKKAKDASNNVVISPTEQFFKNGQEIRIFHISKQIYDFQDIQKGSIATVVVSINEEVLNAICAMEMEERSEVYSINFITDENKNILTYPDSFFAGIRLAETRTVLEFVENTRELREKNIAVTEYKDKNLGWNFYTVYDKDYMLKEVHHLQALSIIIGVALLSISILLIRYTIKLIENSVQNIVNGIQQVQEGNLDVKVEVDTGDEMRKIADNFNTMTDRVQALIFEITEISQKQKESEIRALEAQINPHFLYNTLDSINWMAIEKQEYEISRMLRNLGVILRYSINKSNEMASIEEMADWLEKYISLQQMRFNHAFDYDIYVDKRIREKKARKLLLQPFIENAIIHGFKGVECGGILRVDMTLSENQREICIIIEDNGKGMPKEIVEKFNHRESAIQENGKSIGLQNTFSRMLMYYGEKIFWNVRSIPEIGTIITLRIPISEGEEENDENCDCRR